MLVQVFFQIEAMGKYIKLKQPASKFMITKQEVISGLWYFAKRNQLKWKGLYFAKLKIYTLRNEKSVLCKVKYLYFAFYHRVH